MLISRRPDGRGLVCLALSLELGGEEAFSSGDVDWMWVKAARASNIAVQLAAKADVDTFLLSFAAHGGAFGKWQASFCQDLVGGTAMPGREGSRPLLF